MAIAAIFTPPSMTPAQYDEVVRRLEAAGAGTPPGRSHHVAFGSGSNLRVVDVWETPETFNALDRRDAQPHPGVRRPRPNGIEELGARRVAPAGLRFAVLIANLAHWPRFETGSRPGCGPLLYSRHRSATGGGGRACRG
jgi:hypothetical protein